MAVNKIFQEIGKIHTERSAFDLSHKNITTMNMGYAYPVLNLFAMPGDKFKINVTSLMKAQPMVYPPYIDVMINFIFFFVPSRLLWSDWEDFVSGGKNGDFTQPMPKVKLNSGTEKIAFSDSVFTRLGLLPSLFPDDAPTGKAIYDNIPLELQPSSLPLRAYYKIYNDWFRNENLQDEVEYEKLDGFPPAAENLTDGFFHVNWMKDYFTSALPFQQRGVSPAIPFEATIDTSRLTNDELIGTVTANTFTEKLPRIVTEVDFPGTTWKSAKLPQDGNIPYMLNSPNLGSARSSAGTKAFLDKLSVNIQDTFSISELRTAFQVQKFLERNARSGVRYIEFLKAHFNVAPTDERLDRAELIGGTKFPLIISDMLQSSETATTPLGTRAGVATSAGYTDDFPVDYFVEEFGYIIGIGFIRPVADYFQGINRQYQYTDRFELPMPEFMHLSEQGITESELFIGKDSKPAEIFGYQGIYDELRVCHNRITGLMARKDYNKWHLARIFDKSPKLNNAFSLCNPDSRIFSIEDPNLTAQFLGEIDFNITAIRPMPIIAEPGMIDHF